MNAKASADQTIPILPSRAIAQTLAFYRRLGFEGDAHPHDAGYAILRLNSGETRMVPAECMATVGAVSNPDNSNVSIGKAGRVRWKGRKPVVRGVAMNPIDHPHGGGEGRSSGGRHPVTPWGKSTKGKKTRANKASDKFILRSRHQKKKG